jgi:UDPglucose--hexose-1-phosphate uridylyltransferase
LVSTECEGYMVNEFRRDPVTGDWVLISSLRAKRPHDGSRERLHQTIEECVFEPAHLAEQSAPLATYPHGTMVLKNKFPALQEGTCGAPKSVGPFQTFAANGYHELVITRDHDRHFAQFTTEETTEVLGAYRDRHVEIAKSDCGAYIGVFHNHGRAAGASVYHSHSQILSTPMIPPEVMRSLDGADQYMMQTGRPIHQTMIEWEMQQGRRVVYENDLFIAFCPFVSKAGYQVRIFPKQQKPRFELSSDAELAGCAQALNAVLKKLCTALDDVDYNFYIHTAPVQKDPALDVSAYHWHIDVIPRIPIAAGFELSTTIYINPFDPDDCAKQLRETAI